MGSDKGDTAPSISASNASLMCWPARAVATRLLIRLKSSRLISLGQGRAEDAASPRGSGTMANALIVHRDRLPQSQKIIRAAQYVRMSTDHQRYSIETQAAVIAAHAQLHKLSIVRTYRDEGESGLKIKNRMGLTELIEDVRSGRADFGHVLVFDAVVGGAFRTSTRARTTSSSVSKPGSKLPIARSNSTTTEA